MWSWCEVSLGACKHKFKCVFSPLAAAVIKLCAAFVFSVSQMVTAVAQMSLCVHSESNVAAANLFTRLLAMTAEAIDIFTYRQSFKFLVVSVDPAKDFLAVPLQLLQLFLNNRCIQRFALFNQTFTLSQCQLNLCRVQNDFLLESLRRRRRTECI